MAATFRTSAAGGGTSGTGNRTAAITPAVGDLLIVFVTVSVNTNITPTLTDNNPDGLGAYTLIATAQKGGSADTMSVFVRNALMANTTSTTVTANTGSNTAGEIVIVAVSGMSNLGAAAIRQSAKEENQAAGGTPAPAFGSNALSSNMTLGAVSNDTNPATMTPPTGWTERQDVGQTNPATGLEVVTRDSGFSSTTITWASTSASVFCDIILELEGSLALTETLSDNNSSNWNDNLTLSLTISLQLSDDNSGNWNDSINEGFGLQIPDVIGSGYGTAPFGTDPYGGQLYLQDSVNTNLSSAGALTEVLSDSMSMSDRLGIGYGNRVSDQLVLSDGTIVGYGAATSDQMTIVDVIKSGFGLIAADQDTSWADTPLGIGFGFTEQLVISDTIGAGFGLGTSETLIFSDSTTSTYGLIISDNLNNWNDAVVTAGVLLESLSDNLSNWLDSLIVGYGNIFSEQLTIVDIVGSTFGLITADSINNWSDVPFGIGFGFTEQLVLADSTSLLLTLGINISETITISDLASSSYGLLIEDNDNFWSDNFQSNAGQPQITLSFSDTISLSDSLLVGYGAGTSDSLTIVDVIGAGFGIEISDGGGYGVEGWGTDPYGGSWFWADAITLIETGGNQLTASFSETISMSDVMLIGYGLIISDDNGPNWSDSLSSFQQDYQLTVTEDLNNWQDLVATQLIGAGLTESLSDQMSMSDSLIVGYGAATSDQITIVDVFGTGFGLVTSDSLNNWVETLAIVFNLNIAISEQIVISDATVSGYGLAIAETISNWSDNFQFNAGQPEVQESLSDQLSMSDSLAIGYGNITSDQLVLVDFLQTGFGLITADQMTLSDSVLIQEALLLGFIETITFSDSQLTGYGLQVSDNDNFWNDLFNFNAGQPGIQLDVSDQIVLADSLAVGYGLSSSEQLTITDAAVAGYGIMLSDQMAMTDSFAVAAGRLLSVSDSFPAFSDSLAIGYGLGPSEQLTITDSARSTYGFIVSDTLNFWQDVFQYAGVGTPISINLSDQLSMSDGQLLVFNFLSSQSDVMALTDLTLPSMSFEIKTADQVTTWLDAASLLFEFRVAVGEDLNLWNDFVQQLQLLNLAVQDSDNSWTDELTGNLAYLLSLADDGSSDWKDFAFAGSMFTLIEVLEDDEGANWLDQLVTAIGTGIGPVSVRSITVTAEVLVNSITVTTEVSVADITVDPEVSVETIEVIY